MCDLGVSRTWRGRGSAASHPARATDARSAALGADALDDWQAKTYAARPFTAVNRTQHDIRDAVLRIRLSQVALLLDILGW